MFRVILINKGNRQKVKAIAEHLTESQAERICSQWGWNYSDEQGISYWMDYEKE